MAKTFDTIEPSLRKFIEKQKMYFVATAPLDAAGHINLSPKGLASFAVLDDHTVAYLDLTGSGVETIAHLRDNGRIVIMFCAFDGAPRIVRLHGRGDAVLPGAPEFTILQRNFPEYPGVRSIIRVRLERISDSCGYGVPLYTYQGERKQMEEWAERKGEQGIADYQAKNNATSIDNLPGLPKRS
jgi:hypothetical protein